MTRVQWGRICFGLALGVTTALTLFVVLSPTDLIFPAFGPVGSDQLDLVVKGFAVFSFATIACIFAALIRWPHAIGALVLFFCALSWLMFVATTGVIAGPQTNTQPILFAAVAMLLLAVTYLIGYFALRRQGAETT